MSKSNSGKTTNSGWFRAGRSGNCKGRPPESAAPQSCAFEILMDTKLIVTHHGVAREISLEEALQQQTYKAALAGDRKARREVLKWMMKREAWMKKHPAKAAAPVITNYRSPDPSNADSAIQLLAIAAINPSHAGYGQRRAQLLLEPLAVQFALQRRRGGESLTDKERNEIRRCTRDADSLHWPRGTDA